ncbi:Acetyltransferase (GNAT) domain-containing protein [Microbulbifer marinus]|uniref:Acetyltransferase (GNAT) domain-containing protein n=1 Tax=Microbulbifer marinus TaxID=658218 RepID=A0A1H3WJ55_9GAMM|nr:Acetyltransferase (GNAT) domain-containing protein [Microbulbifer marinus]
MRVENLIERPEAVEQLARWHYREWAHLYPEQSLQDFTEDLQRSLRGAPIPATWVLVDGGSVWGSASVIEHDMTINCHLGPWLANVYIHPDKRGQGLGRLLVAAVMEVCRKNGLNELFLFTPAQEYFYQRLGWTLLKRELYQGDTVSIMTTRLQD